MSLLPEFVDIFEDEEAHFECKVTGHPQPRVAWSRDGKSLSVLSAETSYENGEISGQLLIARIDFGLRRGGRRQDSES